MVLLHTPPKQDHMNAPSFSLRGTDNQHHTLEQSMGKNGLLIMFICNHCPYVLGLIDRLVTTCTQLQDEGIGCVAIMPNDTMAYPVDSFENMRVFSKKYSFTFPYLIDETQETARAYNAICTPDFFGFDQQGLLQYRGRLDSAKNNPQTPDTIPELLNAMLEIKQGKLPASQNPSMGCSIKWRT
ncbi:MAG: thioredoxin family protein [Alphaproteobacteria bacterium]